MNQSMGVLPDPLIQHIFSLLEPRDQARFRAVCRRFRSLTNLLFTALLNPLTPCRFYACDPVGFARRRFEAERNLLAGNVSVITLQVPGTTSLSVTQMGKQTVAVAVASTSISIFNGQSGELLRHYWHPRGIAAVFVQCLLAGERAVAVSRGMQDRVFVSKSDGRLTEIWKGERLSRIQHVHSEEHGDAVVGLENGNIVVCSLDGRASSHQGDWKRLLAVTPLGKDDLVVRAGASTLELWDPFTESIRLTFDSSLGGGFAGWRTGFENGYQVLTRLSQRSLGTRQTWDLTTGTLLREEAFRLSDVIGHRRRHLEPVVINGKSYFYGVMGDHLRINERELYRHPHTVPSAERLVQEPTSPQHFAFMCRPWRLGNTPTPLGPDCIVPCFALCFGDHTTRPFSEVVLVTPTRQNDAASTPSSRNWAPMVFILAGLTILAWNGYRQLKSCTDSLFDHWTLYWPHKAATRSN